MRKVAKNVVLVLIALIALFAGIVWFMKSHTILRWIGFVVALLGVLFTVYGVMNLVKCWELRTGRRVPTVAALDPEVETEAEEAEAPASRITTFRALRHAEEDVADRLIEAEDIMTAAERLEDAVAERRAELERKLNRARSRRRPGPMDDEE